MLISKHFFLRALISSAVGNSTRPRMGSGMSSLLTLIFNGKLAISLKRSQTFLDIRNARRYASFINICCADGGSVIGGKSSFGYLFSTSSHVSLPYKYALVQDVAAVTYLNNGRYHPIAASIA